MQQRRDHPGSHTPGLARASLSARPLLAKPRTPVLCGRPRGTDSWINEWISGEGQDDQAQSRKTSRRRRHVLARPEQGQSGPAGHRRNLGRGRSTGPGSGHLARRRRGHGPRNVRDDHSASVPNWRKPCRKPRISPDNTPPPHREGIHHNRIQRRPGAATVVSGRRQQPPRLGFRGGADCLATQTLTGSR